jgi:putative transposase
MTVVQGNSRPDPVPRRVSAPAPLSPAKLVPDLKGKSSYRLQRECREVQKRYWGQHLGGRGYVCATVGAVTEEQIKRYLSQQEEDTGEFHVWDEPKPSDPAPGVGLIRKLGDDFSLNRRLRL